MFWDGQRWIPERENSAPAPSSPPPARRRSRDWLATGVMLIGLVALVVPFSPTSAVSYPGDSLVTEWREGFETRIFQERSTAADYSGRWTRDRYDQYMGSYIISSSKRGAKVEFSFTGSAISWVGPKRFNRGKARVYLDGRYIVTVDTYSRTLQPRQTVFTRTFAQVGTHTLTIEVLGTAGRPKVSVDAFVVRGPKRKPKGVQPAPTPTPEATAAPEQTTAPAPTTEPAPGPTSTPAPTEAPVDPAPTATASPTASPTATPRPTATPTPTPRPTATPTPAPTTNASVRVTSISGLLAALDDNSVTEIVVANGTYRVSAAASQASNSLWIGARYADRTRPVTVRAETRGGVTFDGGGTTYFGCMSFEEGAHDQIWDGFRCANGQATSTGVVMFGGYAGAAAPHHITLRHIQIGATCTGRATSVSSSAIDHAIYVSKAVGGPHDLVFEDMTVDGRGGLASAFHFYHSDSANKNAWNVTIRRLTVTGTVEAIMLWDPTLHDVTIDGATITNALNFAVRYEAPGATGTVLARITSTGSGSGTGFFSSLGSSPSGVTFVDNSFR